MGNFKNWLLDEMSHIRIPDQVVFSLPGSHTPVAYLDMHFENYPKNIPAQRFTEWSPFIAKLPNSSKYLVHFGLEKKEPAIMGQIEAKSSGYPELPEDWWKYAIVIGRDGEAIQPKIGNMETKPDVTGTS